MRVRTTKPEAKKPEAKKPEAKKPEASTKPDGNKAGITGITERSPFGTRRNARGFAVELILIEAAKKGEWLSVAEIQAKADKSTHGREWLKLANLSTIPAVRNHLTHLADETKRGVLESSVIDGVTCFRLNERGRKLISLKPIKAKK